MRYAWVIAFAWALAACGGDVGTVTVDLITSPNSTILDAVEVLRLTVTQPHQVTEATRGDAAGSRSTSRSKRTARAAR